MRIGTFGLRATRSGWLARERFCWQLQNRKAAHAPQPVTLPVVGPAVISVILLFVLSRHRLVRLNRRAVLNLFPGQIHEQELSGLMETAEGMGRDEHLPPRQPGTRVRDHITNRPVLIVKIEILHMADFAIRRAEFVSVQAV